jgi:hypothetical protein
MQRRIHWTPLECEALARETALGLFENHINAVPSTTGNTPILKPIVIDAQKRALKPERLRIDFGSLAQVTERYWELVPRELKKLQQNGHKEKPAEPPAPPLPPPPSPEEVVAGCSDATLLAEMGARFFRVLGQRQAITVNIPGVDELRAAIANVTAQATALSDTASRLTAKVGELETGYMVLRKDVSRLKPPPPVVWCLGATHETQMFLQRKSEEAHMEVDFRFTDNATAPRAFKADYVLTFAQASHDWDEFIRSAVSRSHVCHIGGRHDQAMVQLRIWLKE